jgi:type IV conjugative transfer system coupling protein TraD
MGSILNTVSEGGQTWAHRVRMLRQVIKIIVLFSFSFALIATLYRLLNEHYDLVLSLWYQIKAEILSLIGIDKVSVNTKVWFQITNKKFGGEEVLLPVRRVLQVVGPKVDLLREQVIDAAYFGVSVFFVSNFLFLGYFLFRGSSSKRRKHISGKRTISSKLLALWLMMTRKASKVRIGPLPLVKGTETQHTLITGGTGSGKSNCLHHVIRSLRSQKIKAIIVDTTGSFVDRYYRPEQDVIINPFDPKGVNWSPWAECESKFDYDELSESFIPVSYHENENYWRTAAKSLFSALLQKLEGCPKNSDIVRWTLFEPLQNLCSFVEGTKAASHMDINSEKTAGSVRSVASSFLECLEHLNDTESPFSIKKWVGESDDSWLFISCKPSERSSITPLISAWISTAVRGVINLEPSQSRRIWFVLDELPTLNKVKGLETLLTEGRKYGACALIALQSPAQLESIYGREGASIISGNCATKIVFAEYDAETAERISRIFGKKEIGECQEGISYGANDIRDGVNLSYQKKTQATVSSSEIQSLVANQAFIKLPGKLPITKVSLPIAK